MTDDQQPAPGAAERRRSTARSAAAKRVRGDFVAQIPKRFSEGFTERIDLIIRIVFMVVVAVGCYLVLEPFLTAILIAAVLAVVTWPVFNKLRSGMRQSSTAAASVMVLSIVVLVLIPLSFLLVALAQQVPRGVQAAAAWLKDPLPILQAVQSIPYAGDWLYGELVSAIDPQTFAHTMQRILEPLSTWVLNAAVNVGSGVMQLAFVTFIVFFFYRDGSWFADRISAVLTLFGLGLPKKSPRFSSTPLVQWSSESWALPLVKDSLPASAFGLREFRAYSSCPLPSACCLSFQSALRSSGCRQPSGFGAKGNLAWRRFSFFGEHLPSQA